MIQKIVVVLAVYVVVMRWGKWRNNQHEKEEEFNKYGGASKKI